MAQEKISSFEPPDLPPSAPSSSAEEPSITEKWDYPTSATPPPSPKEEKRIPSEQTRSVALQKRASSRRIVAQPETTDLEEMETPRQRRTARRRPAAPSRDHIAANDDTPSIGGLIYALNQKPSDAPFRYATLSSIAWGIISLVFGWYLIATKGANGQSFGALLGEPSTYAYIACSLIPIALMWFVAMLAWRAEELRLRSSAMAEVALRLAEPDRNAEHSIASLGQSVRRQVSFMNEAVGRALGRAGELEALVHNEVSVLEQSYEENERKIRGLIQELSGERSALLGTSERVSETLRALGTEIPQLIDRLSSQQIKLSAIIQIAGENLTSVENAVEQTADRLETTLGQRTEDMHNILVGYTSGLADALNARTGAIEKTFTDYLTTLNTSLEGRTANLQAGFENYMRSLETSLSERANILSSSMEKHVKVFSDTIQKQTADLEEQIVNGLGAVRRTSETISRQSLKAIEGLASHSDMLRSVTENLLTQVNSVTNRFETQGQTIMQAANALEAVNFKIDTTLQNRHTELSQTLETLSGKADEFGRFVQTYSSSIESTLSDAEIKARAAAEELKQGAENTRRAAMADIDRLKLETDAAAEELKQGAENTRRAAMADIDRLKLETDAEGARKLEELRMRFAALTSSVASELEGLSTRVDTTAEDVRQRAAKISEEIAAEQAEIREQLEKIPLSARESADHLRRALSDQLKALDQLSALTQKTLENRDITPPVGSYTLPSKLRAQDNISPPSQPPAKAETIPEMRYKPQARPQEPKPKTTPTRETWSLGDLLARASHEDENGKGGLSSSSHNPFKLDIQVISRALDPNTTSAIWSRILSGFRGVLSREFYTNEGQLMYDEITQRLPHDTELQRAISLYIEDFENIKVQLDGRDPTGRLTKSHLMSDTGRVYLFLAHVVGRLT